MAKGMIYSTSLTTLFVIWQSSIWGTRGPQNLYRQGKVQSSKKDKSRSLRDQLTKLPRSAGVHYRYMHTLPGWWFGTFLFFHILGIIIPTDELIFFRGVAQPPTSYIYVSLWILYMYIYIYIYLQHIHIDMVCLYVCLCVCLIILYGIRSKIEEVKSSLREVSNFWAEAWNMIRHSPKSNSMLQHQ